jgi:hypothetical protein
VNKTRGWGWWRCLAILRESRNTQNLGKTRQATYVYHNTETRSRHHCCCGKAVSIKCYECVSWFSGMQSYIVTCVLSGCAVFFTSHIQHDFRETIYRNVSQSKRNWATYYHKHIWIIAWSTHYSYQIVMRLDFSWQIFKKFSDIKFHENLSGGNWVVPRGQTDMMKLIVASHNFVNMPKNWCYRNMMWGSGLRPICLRRGKCSRLSYVWQCTFWFHKTWHMSWPAERPSASQGLLLHGVNFTNRH